MTTEGTNNRETIFGSVFFNDFTEITISDTRFDYFEREKVLVEIETMAGRVEDLPAAMALSKHSRVTLTNF